MQISSIMVSNHLIIKGSENKRSQLHRKKAEVLLLNTFKIYEIHYQLIMSIPTHSVLEFQLFMIKKLFLLIQSLRHCKI